MDTDPTAMNQDIFKLGLPTETVSAYLLCCGLVDEGKTVSLDTLMRVWNGTKEALDRSLEILEERRIIRNIASDPKTPPLYRLTDVHGWVRPH